MYAKLPLELESKIKFLFRFVDPEEHTKKLYLIHFWRNFLPMVYKLFYFLSQAFIS